jgi:hypothetical protein
MKKLLAFILLSIAMVSCYNNYITDFTYDAIYFPNQMDIRTFVVGEGMKFDVGVALSGVHSNNRDRNVSFTFDNTLITAALLSTEQTSSNSWVKGPTASPLVGTVPPYVTALLPLPSNYYTITNANTMVIKSGTWAGVVTIKPDTTLFLNDSLKTMYGTYVLPFEITAADADTVLKSKSTNVVGVKFENMLFGNYWHGGAAVLSKKNQPAVDSITVTYPHAVTDANSKIWTLTTYGPCSLYANGYYNQTVTTKNEMKLVLKGTSIFVSAGAAWPSWAATAPTNTVSANGTSSYNAPLLLQNRKIFLNYKYTSSGIQYKCTDTLFFRNRFRDGVNEWQDENPAHYIQ